MKIIAAFSVFSVIAAQNYYPEVDEDGIGERKFSHILKMVQTQINTQYSFKQLVKMIQNYGCHCFPGLSRAAGGAGAAQDAYDELCRDLARCHKWNG